MLCYGVVVVRVAIVPSAEESRGWGLGAQQPQPLTVCPLPPLGLGQTSQQGVLGGLSIQHVWLSPDTWSHDTGHTQPGSVLGQLLQEVSSSCVVLDISIRGVGWVVFTIPRLEKVHPSPPPSTITAGIMAGISIGCCGGWEDKVLVFCYLQTNKLITKYYQLSFVIWQQGGGLPWGFSTVEWKRKVAQYWNVWRFLTRIFWRQTLHC